MTDTKFLKPREVAERFGVSEITLRSWRYRGKGPKFYRVGPEPHGAIRYKESDILAYEAAVAQEPVAKEDRE